MISVLNNRFISLFNPYDESAKPKHTIQLTEKLFTLISTNISNQEFIECLNHQSFISFIFDNINNSSIDNHIILASVLLRFKPALNHEQIEILITRLMTMFDKHNDHIKQLILSNIKWIIPYYKQDSLIHCFFSPLILKDSPPSHQYENDIKSELELIKSLDGKEKYLRAFIPQLLSTIIRECNKALKSQLIELLEYLLAFKEDSKYLRALLYEISFVETIDLHVPILKYFYYQDFNENFIEFQNLIFTKFQKISKDFESTIDELDEFELDILLNHYQLPILDNDRLYKLKILKAKVQPSIPYDNNISLDIYSKDHIISVPINYPIYSQYELSLRSFQNIKHDTFIEIKEHIKRTVDRLELKSNDQISGSSKYVLKPYASLSIQSSIRLLSNSEKDHFVDLQLKGHGLKLNESVVLINFGKKDMDQSDEFTVAGVFDFVSGVVEKVHSGSKVTIKLDNVSKSEETTYNIVLKMPEPLQFYHEELALYRDLIFKNIANDRENVKITVHLNCTLNQLIESFPNHKIISTEIEEQNRKRKKIQSGSAIETREEEKEKQTMYYSLTFTQDSITINSSTEKTADLQLNNEQIQALISSQLNKISVIHAMPGQGIKTIINSIINILNDSRSQNPILILTKNNYFKQLITYKLISDNTLKFYDILDVSNPQYEEKFAEVSNELDQLQEEFQNNDIYQLEQILKTKFKIFIRNLIESEDGDLNTIFDAYPLKNHFTKQLNLDKDSAIKVYSDHFSSIISQFQKYDDLSLFQKYKNMSSDKYPSKLVFSDRLSKIQDLKFQTIVITAEGSLQKQACDVVGSTKLAQSVVLFQSEKSNDLNQLGNHVSLKKQYTKFNNIFKNIHMMNPNILQSNLESESYHSRIEYVELESQEIVNFKKFYQNPIEREFTLKLCEKLQEIYQDTNSSIGIITPSETQKLLLQQTMKNVGLTDIPVSLLLESNSTEYDIVILNTIRTKPLNELDITESLIFQALQQTRYKLYVISHQNVIKCFNGVEMVKGLTLSSFFQDASEAKKIQSLKDFNYLE